MLKAQGHIQKYLKSYPFLPNVINALEPYQPKLVGGTIRTAFWNPTLFESNLPYTDLDITVNLPHFKKSENSKFDELLTRLDDHDIEFKKRGNRNMLLKFTVDATRQSIDMTSLQKQVDNAGFVAADSWKDCQEHRDFKCNSFCYDLVDDTLYDFVDENSELEGDCSVRFLDKTAIKQDPSRMFRFFRFVAEKYDVENLDNELPEETSHEYDEKSIEKILQHKELCENVPSGLRHLKTMLKYKGNGLVFNKIIELGLSKQFFLVDIENADLPYDCKLQDIADKLEHIQDIPRLCEAFFTNKREHDDLILRRINDEMDLENMIDDIGYASTAYKVNDKMEKYFPTTPYTFAEDSLIQLGSNKSSLTTSRKYPVVRLPKKAYIKEYLVLNC